MTFPSRNPVLDNCWSGRRQLGVVNWDALIREGKVQLEPLPDVRSVLALEEARLAYEMRGGATHKREISY